MPNNSGLILMLGLGALLFLGTKRSAVVTEDAEEGVTLTTGALVLPAGRATDDTSVVVESKVDIGGLGLELASYTELEVRRSEQLAKQALDWSVGAIPSAATGPLPASQGDIEAVAIAAGTFAYGGAKRPTNTAIPVWNNRYGWYWVDPPTGLPVGPGGKLWQAGDKSPNRVAMSTAKTNIGRKLPPGWTANRGGSATRDIPDTWNPDTGWESEDER